MLGILALELQDMLGDVWPAFVDFERTAGESLALAERLLSNVIDVTKTHTLDRADDLLRGLPLNEPARRLEWISNRSGLCLVDVGDAYALAADEH